ncbi:MAG: hypothetical protein IPH97_17555 [Ignavibacteriales bacterium]|nr:hypothetical protein [Ignavibacteriales bacterium]
MIKKILLVIFITSYSLAQQYSPEEVIKQYDEAFLNDDWKKVSGLTHPDEISLFRNNLKQNHFEIAASDRNVKDIDSLSTLSDLDLYAFFLQNLYLNVPSVKLREDISIVGTVYDEKDYAFVVYKREEKYPDIIELKKDNNNWKMKLDKNIRMIFVPSEITFGSKSNEDDAYSNNYDKYNSYNEYDSPLSDNERVKTTMKTVFEMMTDDEFVNNLAIFKKKYYDALLKEGFTKDESLEIITESKSPLQK